MTMQQITTKLIRLTATNGADVMMDFLLAQDFVLDGLCPLEAIAAGDEMRSRVLRMPCAEDGDGFS
jgi:hypothetical protein